MIDLTELETVAADPTLGEKEVFAKAHEVLINYLKPYSGQTVSDDVMQEIADDMERVLKLLLSHKRVLAHMALISIINQVFGGGCGGGGCGGGGCGGGSGHCDGDDDDDCCGGHGDDCCKKGDKPN